MAKNPFCYNVAKVTMKKNLNIAIVEDNPSHSSSLSSFLKMYFEANPAFSYLESVFPSAEAFLGGYEPHQFDLVFLDIRLPMVDGLSLAESLRKQGDDSMIVFVTNMSHLAIKGYSVNAFDFIVKPILYNDFILSMDRILSHIRNADSQSEIIRLSRNRIERFVKASDLLFVEVSRHTVFFHLEQEVIDVRGTLNDYAATLESIGFLQCHRSFYVNPRFIKSVKGFETELANGERVPISHPLKKSFDEKLTKYVGRD